MVMLNYISISDFALFSEVDVLRRLSLRIMAVARRIVFISAQKVNEFHKKIIG